MASRKTLKDTMASEFQESLQSRNDDIEVEMPTEISNIGSETVTAPTEKPNRPRALSIGYNPTTKTVYIVFRDNSWWQYEDVSTDVWLGFKNSRSTNSYLPTLEASCSSHGPAQLRDISAGTLARFSDTASKANSIQKGNLQNWKAQDFFKEN
jgi:hypothetical protein